MNTIPHILKSFLLNPLFKPLLLYQIQAGVANLDMRNARSTADYYSGKDSRSVYGDILSFRGSWVQIPPPAPIFKQIFFTRKDGY